MLKSAIVAASAASLLSSGMLTQADESHALKGSPTPLPDSNTAIRQAGFPQRLSVDENSPYYRPEVARLLGIEFEGHKRPGDVREYCIEDLETGRGWVRIEARLPNGKPRIERGKFVTIRKEGIIKPYWR